MILSEDKAALTGISGVGKKTAERIILELKDTIEKKLAAGIFARREGAGAVAAGAAGAGPAGAANGTAGRGSPLFIEAYLALQGLGFKEVQAKQMVESALKRQAGVTRVEDVVKIALQGGV